MLKPIAGNPQGILEHHIRAYSIHLLNVVIIILIAQKLSN
jgi:hypothetical protein